MSWLRKFPWLSLCLVVLSYSIVGWYAASWSNQLSLWFVEKGQSWGWFLEMEEEAASGLIQAAEIIIVCFISLALTAPIAIITVFVGRGIKSDSKAMIAMLGWSVVIVMAIRWFHYFVNFLLLLCAIILGRLDLQRVGYNKWQTTLILVSFCLGGIAIGWLIFSYQ